jgi:hypothetical protein
MLLYQQTGPWSDSSDERVQNQDMIEQYFKTLRRRVGGNSSKRVFLSLNGKGELLVDEIAQEEVIDVNTNDGTFFMSFDAWMQYFTHFFAGIGEYTPCYRCSSLCIDGYWVDCRFP